MVHTWGLHVKGPVYISLFKPLSIAIAAVLSAIFLGDAIYFGTYEFTSFPSLLNFNFPTKIRINWKYKRTQIIAPYNILFSNVAV